MVTDKNKKWFSSSSGKIEFYMTMEQAKNIAHSGQNDEDVRELSEQPKIKAQMDKIKPEDLAEVLDEYGAWDETELKDHAQNIQRLLWIAAWDIAENEDIDS